MKQYAAIDDTVYFWFAGNDTSGSGNDGASPAADIRLAGAAADAAPVYSPTPVLLSHVNYPAGAYEIAIVASAANGFAADNTYAVFCTLAVDGQNPTGIVGSFDTMPIDANTIKIEGADPTDTIRDSLVDDATRIDASALNTLSGHDPGANLTKAGDLMGLVADAITEAKIANNAIAAEHLNATACTKIIDDFETQSQADPTGFHVNVLEVNGTGQTANDNGADINAILGDTNELQTDWVNGGRLDLILDIIAEDTAVIGAAGAGLTALGDTRLANLDATISSRTKPADTQAAVTTCTTNSDMRGTDNAALASVCTETRQAELDAANLPTDIANVKAETVLIVADTNELQTDWVDGGRLDLIQDACALEATVALLNNISVADIIAGISDGSFDLQEMQRIMFAVLTGKSAGGGTATLTFRDPADIKNRVSETVDGDGNRTAVTRDGS